MSVRDEQQTSDRSSIRGATGYQPPTWQDRRRIRGGGSGHHGIARFLAFALLLASIVLVGLVTIGRPILASTVVGWATDNPSAYTMPFVSTLVEEDLGSKLTTAASDDAS